MREKWLAGSILVLSAILAPGEARAEEVPYTVVTGSRIRFLTPADARPVQGTVLEVDAGTLLVSTDDREALRVSRQAITRLEVAVGRRRNARKGLFIGAAVGALVAGMVAFTPSDSLCPPFQGDTRMCLEGMDMLMKVAIPVAALEGAAIGALIKSDRWSPVDGDGVRIGLAPTRGRGVAVAVSLGL
jgi:hypothetical protein